VSVISNGRGCCYYVNRTPAGGPWDSVVLSYTGTAVNGVYDSSYRAYVGGAEVLFGTTPEYGTWNVLDNITEYESLLEPGANFTFILSAALVGGYFVTNISLLFYPPPAGGPVPVEPTKVVPLWSLQFVKPTSPSIAANATIPSNASAVTLELWSYGFQSDEFWWAASSPARSVDIHLDVSPFDSVYPFSYVNTGGVDLFLWRPIPAAFTLSDRPYHVNLTGALGALEGAHTYTASIGGREANSDWLVEGSMLVWTNSTVQSASLTSRSATLASFGTSGSTESSFTAFQYNSTIATTAGNVQVASTGAGTFAESVKSTTAPANGTSWENVSQNSRMLDTTTAVGPNGTTYANSSRDFVMATNLGSQFVVTKTTGGTYPITGNATTSMLAVQQQWTEVVSTQGHDPFTGTRVATSDSVDDEVTGANGIWDAVETIPSSGASPTIVSIGFVQSATPKYTTETVAGAPGTSSYSHLMVGSDFAPTNANGAETILENLWQTTPIPLVGAVAATPDPVDVGETLAVTAVAHGGGGVYSYGWSGLPPGCAPSNSSVVSCQPTQPGLTRPVVTVRDSLGDQAVSAPATLVVYPALDVRATPSALGVDVGGSLSFSAAIAGGTPPYSCSWTLPGGFPTMHNCTAPVPASPSTAGTVNATVSVADASGAVANATSPTVRVAGPLVLYLTRASNASAPHVGAPTTFTVTVSGGTPPVALTWFEGGAVVPGFNGTTLAWTPNATGNLSVSVLAVDGSGASARSNLVALTVGTSPGSGSGNGSTTAPNEFGATFWAAVALAALAGVEAVLLLATRRPRRPARPRPPESAT